MINAKYDKVMIVTHPDDESLWGGNALEKERDWLVICVTNASNAIRAKQFNDAMDVFQVEHLIWDFPDLGDNEFPADVAKELEGKIEAIVNQSSVKKVVTHNPDGEYGHIAHKTISRMVKSVLADQNKLHYFSFSKPGAEVSALKKKAFDIYFGPVHGDSWTTKLMRLFSFLAKYSIKFVLSKLKLRKYDLYLSMEYLRSIYVGKGGIAYTDLEHCNLSRFESIVHYSNYKSSDELLSENYADRRPLNNAHDVYLASKDLYDRYPDRKYLITEYLPSCTGKTLGVGCHIFNKNDAYCLPKPSDYETIDISDKYAVYGSPFKHTTIDFMAYRPEYKYDHVILFGVMGIPFASQGDEDTYSLYNRDDETLRHIDELMNVGGTVLLGPDFSIDKSKTVSEKIKYWDNFFKNDETLKNKYKLIKQFRTNVNYVIVCQKVR